MSNPRKMAEALGKHYGVPQGTMNMREWVLAVKKKANAEDESLEVLHERTFSPKTETKVIEGTAKDITPKSQPMTTEFKVDGAQQRVEVAAPHQHFHLAPATVHVSPGDVSWSYTFQRLGHLGFVFLSGSMFGLLLALGLRLGSVR